MQITVIKFFQAKCAKCGYVTVHPEAFKDLVPIRCPRCTDKRKKPKINQPN